MKQPEFDSHGMPAETELISYEEGIRFIPRELAKNGDSALVKQGDFIIAKKSEDIAKKLKFD